MEMQSMSINISDDTLYDREINSQKEKIIIVDDNLDQLIMYKFLFTGFNNKFDYVIFSSAEKAINYIKRLDNKDYKKIHGNCRINLIISDYNMYPINGLEFYKELIKNEIYAPFVLFTSFLSDKIEDEANDLGIQECVQKEIDIQETLDKLKFYLV